MIDKFRNHIQKAIKFPEAIKRNLSATLVRPLTYESFPDGSHIDIEWDNLIILDGCRYDIFESNNPFGIPARQVESRASHTTGFLKRNFTQKRYDTVYVTASPQLVGYESWLHDVVHVWKDEWNEGLRTVHPKSITENTLKAHEDNPDKKLISHYMQPHYPFIGPTGRELESHATFTGGLQERQYHSIWELLSSGQVSKEEVWQAYKENLEIVLEEVIKLTKNLDGKTVITSDHGNLFGERVSLLPIRLYGHPPNMPAKGLIQVPMVELPFESRREITASPPREKNLEVENVESRLEDLGYLQ
jgi:hypothetical protein